MSSHRVLVTGAAGLIGRSVVHRLLQEHFHVRALVRSTKNSMLPNHPNLEIMEGDITDEASICRALSGTEYVVHLAALKNDETDSEAVNVGGATLLAKLSKEAGVQRIINVSTQSVRLKKKGTYARTKAESDRILEASGVPVTTLRPSVVYGDLRSGVLGSLMQFAARPVVPIIGSGKVPFRPIHRDDLTAIITVLLKSPESAGMTFDVGGTEEWTFDELVKELQRWLGAHGVLLHIPIPVAYAVAVLISRMRRPPITRSNVLGASEPLPFDPTPILALTGVKPRSLKESLDRLFGDYEAEIRREETRMILAYVLPGMPSGEETDVYLRACDAHQVDSNHRLSRSFVRSRLLLGTLDAMSRIRFPQGTFQKKLLIASAVRECSPASAPLLLPKERGSVAVFMELLAACFTAGLKLLFGFLLLLFPSFLRRNAGS